MQQMTGQAMTTLAKSLDSSTGPGAEAITGVRDCGNVPHSPDSSATVTIHVTHNKVIITARLDMGGYRIVQQVWSRRRGRGAGWVLTKGSSPLLDGKSPISPELAEFVDNLSFPFDVANMLPGKRATAAAVAQAVQEVANG